MVARLHFSSGGDPSQATQMEGLLTILAPQRYVPTSTAGSTKLALVKRQGTPRSPDGRRRRQLIAGQGRARFADAQDLPTRGASGNIQAWRSSTATGSAPGCGSFRHAWALPPSPSRAATARKATCRHHLPRTLRTIVRGSPGDRFSTSVDIDASRLPVGVRLVCLPRDK